MRGGGGGGGVQDASVKKTYKPQPYSLFLVKRIQVE